MFLDAIFLKYVVKVGLCAIERVGTSGAVPDNNLFSPADFSIHAQHSDDNNSCHEGKDRATKGGS